MRTVKCVHQICIRSWVYLEQWQQGQKMKSTNIITIKILDKNDSIKNIAN